MGKSNSTRRANAWSVPIGAWSRRSSAADACSVAARRQGAADACAQFGGGLLGERDRRHAGDVDPVVDEVGDAVDERAGLARSRAGLDEQRRVEIVPDAGAPGLVGRQVGRRSGPVLAGEVLSGPVLS